MDIIVTAPIALKATAEQAREHREELCARYAPSYVRKALEIEKYAMARPETEAVASREITIGGVEAALWELAEETKTGLCVELRDIPIRQETVEVFNTLDADPYILESFGSWLLFVKDGASVLARLRVQGYNEAAVIGYTTKEKKRTMIYSGVERFLLPPKRYI